MVRNWLSMLGNRSHAARQAEARRRRRARTDQAWLPEGLEPRCLLSASAAPTVFMVSNTNDSGTGSLRAAITNANDNTSPAGSVIEFDPTVFSATTPQTITLTSGKLELSEFPGPEVIDGPART